MCPVVLIERSVRSLSILSVTQLVHVIIVTQADSVIRLAKKNQNARANYSPAIDARFLAWQSNRPGTNLDFTRSALMLRQNAFVNSRMKSDSRFASGANVNETRRIYRKRSQQEEQQSGVAKMLDLDTRPRSDVHDARFERARAREGANASESKIDGNRSLPTG
jgi:hypothetical protein